MIMSDLENNTSNSFDFDKAFNELKAIKEKFEGGNVSVNEMVSLVERGAELKEQCMKKLAETQELVNKSTGEVA